MLNLFFFFEYLSISYQCSLYATSVNVYEGLEAHLCLYIKLCELEINYGHTLPIRAGDRQDDVSDASLQTLVSAQP